MAKVVFPRSLQRLLVHLFVETLSLFTGRRRKRRGGVGLRFMGRVVLPPKYWHSTSPVLWRQKSSTPGNIDIPTWAFYCLRPTVVSARCSPITLNCLPFRPPEGLFLTGKLLFIVKLVLERSHKVLTFTYSASCSFSVKFKWVLLKVQLSAKGVLINFEQFQLPNTFTFALTNNIYVAKVVAEKPWNLSLAY